MKKLHLLCNAHLDPVWLWQKNEGIAEAISTFRVAADFCEKYDGFIFNHNESILYEWVEKYEPELFKRIQKLVKDKKWMIMGGWYLQPDCVMTSGESLLSQIDLGQEYFEKKFGTKPTTAINFDPFGHSRGLVQILKTKGYDSYIFMRPYSLKGDFWWEGFDGSKILAHGVFESYASRKGEAKDKVLRCLETNPETGLCLWGIGNHGGGPSKIDLESINALIEECKDTKIIHSSAEGYISEVDTYKLQTVSTSLGPCMVGCYTSMVRIKQANRRVENKIAMTEKILSYANMNSDVVYDKEKLMEAKKALAFCQFHDILPGSGIKPVEDDSLKTLSYAEELSDELFSQGFFSLCSGQIKAKDGEIPLMIFNPHPYEIEGEFEAEFLLGAQNWDYSTTTIGKVCDERGNELTTQIETENSSLNLDWVKRICFRGKLAPSGITRFDCKLKTVNKEPAEAKTNTESCITVTGERMKVSISKKTGLIESCELDGKQYLTDSGIIEVYRDNEDAWGMTVDGFNNYEDSFRLMSDKDANSFIGYPEEKISNVRIIEDGDVRTRVQALFSYNRSVALVVYTIPKHAAYIDVNITIFSSEINKMLKYRLNTSLCGTPFGETAFGSQELPCDESEAVFHKWCGIKEENTGLYVLNTGTYGGSFTESTIKLSLLRTPVYSGHSIDERPIAPHDRYKNHIDTGERSFSFRITADENIDRQAQIFNEAPYALSFFPSGDGKKPETALTLDNPQIIMSSLKKKNDKYIITAYNTSDSENNAIITLPALDKKIETKFNKHELKIIEID